MFVPYNIYQGATAGDAALAGPVPAKIKDMKMRQFALTQATENKRARRISACGQPAETGGTGGSRKLHAFCGFWIKCER
jgi:hypothetical protein